MRPGAVLPDLGYQGCCSHNQRELTQTSVIITQIMFRIIINQTKSCCAIWEVLLIFTLKCVSLSIRAGRLAFWLSGTVTWIRTPHSATQSTASPVWTWTGTTRWHQDTTSGSVSRPTLFSAFLLFHCTLLFTVLNPTDTHDITRIKTVKHSAPCIKYTEFASI